MKKNELLDQGVATAPTRVECEPKHSPLPWEYSQERYLFAGTAVPIPLTYEISAPEAQRWIAHTLTEANAQFILRACNSHDDLIAALKVARLFIITAHDHQQPYVKTILERVEAAIAKAEA